MWGGWREGVAVSLHAISAYYAAALLLTFVAVLLSWRYTDRVRTQIKQSETMSDTYTDDSECIEDLSTNNADNLQSKLKTARHRAIIDELTSNMTTEQIEEEKEIEKAQLAAILNLLKKQEDKFQVSNMEELEEQLSLYR